jgi:hypothetical protein
MTTRPGGRRGEFPPVKRKNFKVLEAIKNHRGIEESLTEWELSQKRALPRRAQDASKDAENEEN